MIVFKHAMQVLKPYFFMLITQLVREKLGGLKRDGMRRNQNKVLHQEQQIKWHWNDDTTKPLNIG
jgi:hypothetical protein